MDRNDMVECARQLARIQARGWVASLPVDDRGRLEVPQDLTIPVPLSGELPGGWTPQRLADEFGLDLEDDSGDLNDLCDEFETAFDAEISREFATEDIEPIFS